MNILDLTLVKALERMQAGEFSAVEYVRAMLERSRDAAHLNADSSPGRTSLFCVPGPNKLSVLGAPEMLLSRNAPYTPALRKVVVILNGRKQPTFPTITRNTDFMQAPSFSKSNMPNWALTEPASESENTGTQRYAVAMCKRVYCRQCSARIPAMTPARLPCAGWTVPDGWGNCLCGALTATRH